MPSSSLPIPQKKISTSLFIHNFFPPSSSSRLNSLSLTQLSSVCMKVSIKILFEKILTQTNIFISQKGNFQTRSEIVQREKSFLFLATLINYSLDDQPHEKSYQINSSIYEVLIISFVYP
jgi:hypothetical protein